jgi:hypothetical protein
MQDVTADLDITIKYVLFGNEKTERAQMQRVFHFEGPAAQRRVNVDDIEILRDARTTVEAIHGAFDPTNGGMSLSANVKVSYALFTGQEFIGLGTGAASSGSMFTDTGSPYDSATGKLKLVGGGLLTSPIQTEFFVTVDCTFSGPIQ